MDELNLFDTSNNSDAPKAEAIEQENEKERKDISQTQQNMSQNMQTQQNMNQGMQTQQNMNQGMQTQQNMNQSMQPQQNVGQPYNMYSSRTGYSADAANKYMQMPPQSTGKNFMNPEAQKYVEALDRYEKNTINNSETVNQQNMEQIHRKMAQQKAKEEKNKLKAEKKAAKKNVKKGASKGSFGKKAVGLVASALVFGLVAGVVFQGVRYGSDKFLKDDSKKEEVQTSSNKDTSSILKTSTNSVDTVYDVTEVSEKVMPSIVSITGTYVTTYEYWFQSYEQESAGAGSGIIIGQDDDYIYIATNYHVVENAKELSVSFIDDTSAEAKVKGYDESNDIAVVLVPTSDVDKDTLSKIEPITIGSSEDLKVGSPCVAIGNALGYGQSVTVGYVSAVNREISVADGTVKVVQTDAAINPGNSGGALVNMQGELIGINTAKLVDSQVEGMGYALPISEIEEKINNIVDGKENESSSTGNAFLGITPQDVTSEYAQSFDMPEGVYVKAISQESPAEKAGLETGDIIVSFNGKDIKSVEELQDIIGKCSSGDKVKVEYYRNNGSKYEKDETEVTLADKSDFQ